MKIKIVLLTALILAFSSIGFAQSKTTRKTANTTSDIREVDFKNFDYGALCAGEHKFLAVPEDKLVLRKGHQQQGDEMNYADLGSVQYVDFDADGKEEAFVVINGQTAGSSNRYLAAYVFAYQNGSAKQIWTQCEESSVAVLKGRSILFTRPEWVGDDAHCCFSYARTDTYGWKGSEIALISTKREKTGSESSNARPSSKTETIEQLAKALSVAFTANELGRLDAGQPNLGTVRIIVEHSISGELDARNFKSFGKAEQWFNSRERADGPARNSGPLLRCRKGVCTYEQVGMLHNNLYLQKVTYGYRKGRPYIKVMYVIDGD
jgi:hypothetical protein